MRLGLLVSICAITAWRPGTAQITPPSISPYAGEQTRQIKALSSEEIEGYRAGSGMGYALSAELNGYPGPRHVLELADSLALTPEQRRRVEERFEAMRAEAMALGRQYLSAEGALEQEFAGGQADGAAVRALVAEASRIEAAIRTSHLLAHVDMMEVLTPNQVHLYNTLRGYMSASPHQGHDH
jgi:Spy/CpxP family protein refolding chaperone